jgi:hypothetical protein
VKTWLILLLLALGGALIWFGINVALIGDCFDAKCWAGKDRVGNIASIILVLSYALAAFFVLRRKKVR